MAECTLEDNLTPCMNPDCNREEWDYDLEHRKLLGIPPGKCVKPLPGYPTAAAGWLAAVNAAREREGR